jgi:gamma-glutamyltranspeptidase / glutathione hydrolase
MSGVIAAGHELTAQSGAEILRAGGNAFDAALAALATACVVEPALASLGGGGFLLAQPSREAVRLYDFFVQTPRCRRAASELDFRPIIADFGTAEQEFHIGQGAVATPGIVRGLFAAHRDLGTLPMRDILHQAVRHAHEGIRVNALQAYIFGVIAAVYRESPAAMAIYGSHDDPGRLPGEGETLRQPALADTLESLAVEGEDLFYRGEIAASIVREMRSGGHLEAADLAGYTMIPRRPLALDYRKACLFTNPPPASGGLLVAFGLRLLCGVDFAAPGFGSPEHLERLTRVLALTQEARLAACAQGSTAHPDDDALLLDPAFLDRYRRLLAGQAPARRGTTHISVIDARGNVATLSVSNGEGSGCLAPDTGIMLNNMLGEQDLNPDGFHRWPTDIRMTSMMAPALLNFPDGRVIALGSGGSNRIRSAILQVVSNLVDFGMDVEEAVTAPRIHLEEQHLSVEGGFETERLHALLAAYPSHHLWEDLNLFFGGVHTVLRDGASLRGAGDPRRGGACTVVA